MNYSTIIQQLLNSKITSYRIAKDTRMTPQYIDNYRTGKSKVENMALGKAEILVSYYQNLDTNGQVDTTDYPLKDRNKNNEGDLNNEGCNIYS